MGRPRGRQVECRGKLTPVLGTTDVLPYGTFTALLPGVSEVYGTIFKAVYQLCKSPQASV